MADRYPFADARLTRDVDVLVRAADIDRAWNGLRARGYTQLTDAVPHHAPGLVGPRRVGVELHTSMAHALAADLAWERATGDAETVMWHGAAVRVPSATELLWHGTTHALLHDPSAFRLRYFLDATTIMAGPGPIRWDRIRGRIEAGQAGDAVIARAWLGAAAVLAGAVPPADVLAAVPPFDVARAFAWRLLVLERAGWSSRVTEGLIMEGMLAELGLPRRGVVAGTGPAVRWRRRAAALAARTAYRAWASLR